MKTLKKWWNKPVTWGGYTKMVGITYLITLLITVIMYLCTNPPKLFNKKSYFGDSTDEFEDECDGEIEES